MNRDKCEENTKIGNTQHDCENDTYPSMQSKRTLGIKAF
jgi:hypothetical protein